MGYSRKKNQTGGVEDMEFPKVLVFGLGISKGSNKNLQNFQGGSFFLSRISRDKVKKRKIPGVFEKRCSQPPCLFFSGTTRWYIINKLKLIILLSVKVYIYKCAIYFEYTTRKKVLLLQEKPLATCQRKAPFKGFSVSQFLTAIEKETKMACVSCESFPRLVKLVTVPVRQSHLIFKFIR